MPRTRPAVASIVTFLVAGFALACGGPAKPPKRGVLERDVGGWSFRRYQKVLDVEVWVPENKASAYTASYARKEAEKGGRIEDRDVVNAFVTRYKRSEGVLRAFAKFARRLGQEAGYRVEEEEIGGVRVVVVAGAGETWAMWAADGHVVKIGGRGLDSVPSSLVEAYGDRYPSRIGGGVLDGPLPEGPDEAAPAQEDEPFDPDNPTPDWQN